ncbi:single-stranded DNA-binding protein [Leucobacter sp. OH2974_COT-288]|uniref:Single-stranded DNA-binding protein n=1 Tax=Canibacter oris TaxID=1365628 RepID=A0A840DDL7_9MICO|nr:single-stranded DNA-binding protein [Canibacter oris]MBB4071144.1 single-strand DNA-binding protein [Canibacter oris]RRD35574.1 single-stranded DNA-binding protein [Leucobacter sp. OH2974_COT-288]
MNEPQITVVGNVVADPELRMGNSGRPWVNLRIASTPRVRDRNTQEWVDGEPLWLGCTAFGDFAENIANTLTKGMRVVVQGRLSSRSYTDNQGQQRTSLDLMIDEIGPSLRFATAQVNRSANRGGAGQFGAAPTGAQPQTQAQSAWGAPPQAQAAAPAAPWGEAAASDSDFGEDIPF